MRKPTFPVCENKGCEADQHVCFLYMDSTIPLLLLETEILTALSTSVNVWASLCRTWLVIDFLMTLLICLYGHLFHIKCAHKDFSLITQHLPPPFGFISIIIAPL